MKNQKLPKGWSEKRLRELAAHHDRLSEDEQAKETDAAVSARGQTVMVVPTKLVPQVQALILSKRGAAQKR